MRASTSDEAIRLVPHRQLNLEQATSSSSPDDELRRGTPQIAALGEKRACSSSTKESDGTSNRTDETSRGEKAREEQQKPSAHVLIPAAAVRHCLAEDFDRQGTHIRSFIPCPNCGKRRDPKNRVLRLATLLTFLEGEWLADR